MYHSLLGSWPEWLSWLPGQSPAWLILIFPLSFRFTCYYYRKAYYRAFALNPPACAVQPIQGIPSKVSAIPTVILTPLILERGMMGREDS